MNLDFDIGEQLKKYNTRCISLLTGLPPWMKTPQQIEEEKQKCMIEEKRRIALEKSLIKRSPRALKDGSDEGG